MKVAICTPHGGSVKPQFYRNLWQMQNATLQHQFFHMELDLMIVSKARDVLVEDVLQRIPDVEVLWFIDSDVLIPPDASRIVQEAADYGVVSGLYFNRHQPYNPQAYMKSLRKGEEDYYEPLLRYPAHGCMVVEAVGAGCLAVAKRVVVTMKELYKAQLDHALALIEELDLDVRHRKALKWVTQYASSMSPWFEFLDQKGEDFYFCERAREAGFPIFLDVDVKCIHMGDMPVEEGHFKYLVEHNKLLRYGPNGEVIDPVTGRVLTPEEVKERVNAPPEAEPDTLFGAKQEETP